MKYVQKIWIILLGIFLVNQNLNAQFGFQNQEILDFNVYQSFDKIQPEGEIKLAFKVSIFDEWHINSNQPKEDYLIPTEIKIISDEQIQQSEIVYPKAHDIKLDFSDIPLSVFEGEVFIGTTIKIPKNSNLGEKKLFVEFTYQGCNNVSCMAPTTIQDTIIINVVDKSEQIQEINSEIFGKLNLEYTSTQETVEDDSLASQLEKSGLLLTLIIVFLGGLALNLTPCVYPLIPITIGFFGGQSEGKTSKLFLMGLFYVLGMALTYSVVGVITALSGAVFGILLQNPIVIVFIVLVFIALSLSMFGVYEFKLPDSLVAKAGGAKSGFYGAFFMGLTMGIVAAPCIGPFVIGLVTYVAAKGDPFYGFLLFFVMAVGLGLPYLILALFSGKIKSLPRAGFWMDAVKHIFGFILLGMAIYFAEPLLPKEVAKYLLPIFMAIAGITLLFMDKKASEILGFRIFKILFSALLLAGSIYLLWPTEQKSLDWQYYTEDNYKSALDNNEKMIIDFYADWCIPCKELDALTFSNEKVIAASKSFTSMKVDMTKTLSDETEIIRKKFDIKGMPTVLIIDSKGNEVERITGFVNADEFLKIIEPIK
ncbi:MAG: protein-disulfide reductase DsbD [Ignavibacteriales bacterium]|nr:protein-disulfide reductase DsbD [Ignavibacteriales bacterium]MCB9210646.1 protein-disulfide reductase DsbD [Ignavibacteriales bacterium]MCB9218752.1 protein-disulfide reductase DsbD [Ignavibacteriales bacterium]MCB9259244.1 protein-disulfide reductase DsbD [Ignavibacteriales bacterium]